MKKAEPIISEAPYKCPWWLRALQIAAWGFLAFTVFSRAHASEVQPITDKDFAEKALGNGCCVVEFYSTWCQPCKELMPIYERVCGDCKSVKFYRFRIEDGTVADETHHITKLPTVVIFKDGREIARKLGHELLVDGAREKFVAWVSENVK